MATTVNAILHDALELPAASRAQLVEKLNESIEADIDPALQQAHLKVIRQRREEIASGKVQLVDGDVVLQQARKRLRR